MKALLVAVAFLTCATIACATTTSKNLTITVVPPTQTISSIALSNSSTTTGLPSVTPVGTLSVSMSPVSPTFSYTGTNLHLSTSGADSGGVCNTSNGAGNGSFQISSGDTLATNGSLTAGAKQICVAAAENGARAAGTAFTITVGHRIDAAAGVGTGGCTGSGTSASPWNYLCIQNAVNGAVNGDTVFLRAGNWQLNTADAAQVRVSNKSINLVGAGSGNTFDAYGHVNNANGVSMCPTGASPTITCVYSFGTSFLPGVNPSWAGGILFGNPGSSQDTGCTNINISHINFDAEYATGGGDYQGLLVVRYCKGPTTITDIRHLTYFCQPSNTGCLNNPETMIFPDLSDDFTLTSSMISEPQSGIFNGNYPGNFVLEPIGGQGLGNHQTISNTIFYQFWPIPTDNSNAVLTGSAIYMYNDGVGSPSQDAYYGPTGITMGGLASVYCPEAPSSTGQCIGSDHIVMSNNLFFSPGAPFAIGPGVNDPTTNGGLNDINITGNWLIADNADIDACVWHPFNDQGNCLNNQQAMAINTLVDTNCVASDNHTPFNITNNSLIGTSVAQVNGSGTDSVTCFKGPTQSGASVLIPTTVYGLNAQNNYFQSPSNQYTINSNTKSPVQNNNYCTPAAGTVSGCATAGFTKPPTVSFSLGTLNSATGIVPINSPSFTAQYGAVKWLASTSSTTPTSSGQGGLPGHFGIGLKNGQTDLSWMTNSRVPWDYRNTYLNPGWENLNSPSGSFVKNYAMQGYVPIFTWYEIGGGSWGNPSNGLFTSSGLQSPSNMNGVFTSFVLALQNAAASGVSPIIFHIEPDLWGFMQQTYGDDASIIPVSVASSGYSGLGSLPNTAAGFAQALVLLRNTYAPGVLLAWNASDWGPNNGFDPTLATFQSYNTPQVTGQRVATFYKSLGASFNLIFHDPSDADSAYKVLVRGNPSSQAWWTNTAFSNYLSYVGAVYGGTALQSMLWQVPSGNTLYLSENNTNFHYQDNRPQYFLQAGNRQNISNYVGQGVVGLVFGFGGGTTDYQDDANDGITNPPAICGNPFCTSADNTATAIVSDDDGGFIRSAGGAYYSAGPVQLPGGVWSYTPPVSLSSVTHGSTVYMWVMDSANHISAAASAVVP